MSSFVDRLHEALAEWKVETVNAQRENGVVRDGPMTEIVHRELGGRHTFTASMAGIRVAHGAGASREQAARLCWMQLAGVHEGDAVAKARPAPVPAPAPVSAISQWHCYACGSRVTAKRPGYWSAERSQVVHVKCFEQEAPPSPPPETPAPGLPLSGSETRVKAHKRIIRVKGGPPRVVKIPEHTRGTDGPKRRAG